MMPFCKYKAKGPRLEYTTAAILSELRPYALTGTLRGKRAFTNGRFLLAGKPHTTTPTKPYHRENKKRGGRFDYLEPRGPQVEIFPLAVENKAVFLAEPETDSPQYHRWADAFLFDGIKRLVPNARFFVLKRELPSGTEEKNLTIMIKNEYRALIGFLMPLRIVVTPSPTQMKELREAK